MSDSPMRTCKKCGPKPLAEFPEMRPGEPRAVCRSCFNEARRLKDTERATRVASDHEALKPGDLKEDYTAPNYDREKKQEYNAQMGTFAGALRSMAEDPEKLASFISLTAEQERRWMNKRLARSQSIAAARELLMMRNFEQLAERVKWDVRSHGYAARPKASPANRIAVLGLSDLHIGANLPAYENPEAFDFTAASRRLARLAHETAEFKTQYRDRTKLVLALTGDVIEGLLGWNDRDNAPLAEQMVAFSQMAASLVQYLAAAFPEVEVVCEPGNHGRNKLVHPGRATSSKWDSFETVLYKFLQAQCRPLGNVKFTIPRAPDVVVPLFDKFALFTHGDTEHLLGSPGSKSKTWEHALLKVNGERKFGVHVSLFFAGHFHEPRVMIFPDAVAVSNGALVPGNGHSRTAGYSAVCGQWLWEAVPGHAFGDSRFLRVGPKDDSDSTLDDIIPRYEFDV